MKQIGIESANSFGDILFNIPLMRAIKAKYRGEIWVAVKSPYKDALVNIPEVDRVVEIPDLNHGIPRLQKLGCQPVFQITQQVKFYEFKKRDPQHSLIDTPTWTGRQLGIVGFDPKPVYRPTPEELDVTSSLKSGQPTIAIECEYRSAQSWAQREHIEQIVDKYQKTHRILWLSNTGAPDHPAVDDLLRFNRRGAIAALRFADKMFSVGSGFFCASLALPSQFQPQQIICLWKDDLYRYRERVTRYNWHRSIKWLESSDDLTDYLSR